MELNIFQDCWELVQRFQRLVNDGESCEFEVFCRCWREMQLQHLFTAQTNHTEVIATTLAALHVAKRLSCSRRTTGDVYPATRAQRIGGFYLLYVIFYKQPTHNFIKIEVSPRTWQELTDYALDLRKDSPERKDTQQIAYMLWRLVQEQAFRFTALDYCQGLDNLVDYDRVEIIAGAKEQRQRALMQKQQRPNNESLTYELEGLRALDQASQPLCELESAYNAQKKKLAAGHEHALPPTQIFGHLREVFADIQSVLGAKKSTPDEECPTTSTSNQLEVRQRVRNKAMYGVKEREPQHQEEELEVELEVNDAYQRRMSSATVFQMDLPNEVQQEYEIFDFSDDEEKEVGESEVSDEEFRELLGT
ncbi:uncharacterized protein LOC6553091 [Drosophila erecta]|uniref:GG20333 n=1 Tax=Drosophila erecta TaxID=7220 RepID=B3P3W2_DROER|nr:uncharacterized protein LOC6553091 [Drosophila erecta]EDV49068.1 uncharacterized protein Dere_GG20333 [Drosophila erecta]